MGVDVYKYSICAMILHSDDFDHRHPCADCGDRICDDCSDFAKCDEDECDDDEGDACEIHKQTCELCGTICRIEKMTNVQDIITELKRYRTDMIPS